MFIDRVTVHLRAGNGGAGVVAFVKSRGRPQGKPTGGSGGDGGAVFAEVDPSMVSLLRYRRNPHHQAGHGTHGSGDRRTGRRGEDLVLGVPAGTIVRDESGRMVADLVAPGQRVLLVPGGRGGRGNYSLISSRLRAPTVAEQGEYGTEHTFDFELNLLADAALVGFPNAGKSTFISRVSAATPKIADYPFTTLEPNLGVVSIDDREFVLADIPGLIEGAAEGKGLGHEFLRHVQRAQVLVFLLDPSHLQDRPVREQYEVLLGELEAFNPELAARPRLVVVSKVDAVEDPRDIDMPDVEGVMSVSALTGEGLRDVLFRIADLVDTAERHRPDREGYVLHRPVLPAVSVVRRGDAWVVEGLAAQRAVRFADLTNEQAADLAAQRLARLGVDARLATLGAKPGDTVRIGDLDFEYEPSWFDDPDEDDDEVIDDPVMHETGEEE